MSHRILECKGILAHLDDGWAREVNVVSWEDRPAMIDIRHWNEDHSRMSRGIILDEDEAIRLTDILKSRLPDAAFFDPSNDTYIYESEGDRFGVKLLAILGTLSVSSSGWSKLVTISSWTGGPPKVDIRLWSPGYRYMSRGITLSRDEAVKLALIDPSLSSACVLTPESAVRVSPKMSDCCSMQPENI